MDSQENRLKDYRRTYRASLVPQSKNDRWQTITQSPKNDSDAKIQTGGPSSGGKVKGKELLRAGEVFKKPPFVVPGVVRPNDNFFKSEGISKNPIKKSIIKRPLYLPKPKPIVSHFTSMENKPINSCKHTVLPTISVSQSDEISSKTSEALAETQFAAVKGLKIVEPVSILKKSPNRKANEDETGVSEENQWITVGRRFTSIQENFSDLSPELGSTAIPRVSFLDQKSVKNDDILNYHDNSRSSECSEYLNREFESESWNVLVASESNDDCEHVSDLTLKQTNQWRTSNLDSVSEEAEKSYSSNEETELSLESEFEPNAECLTANNLGSMESHKPVSSFRSVQEEPSARNDDSSRGAISEIDSSSSGNPNQVSNSTKSTFCGEAAQSFDENHVKNEAPGKRRTHQEDLSEIVSSTEVSLSTLHLGRHSSDSGFSDEVLRLRQRLDAENSRLKSLCSIWEMELEENVPPLETGNVLTVIRQTQQLLREKFNQYTDLINQFENKTGRTILVDDLEGFWELIQLQVDDVDRKFTELKLLKKNNWAHEESIVFPKRGLKKRKVVTTPRGLRSNIRVHIAAARKKQPCKLYSSSDRATPLLRTPVKQHWNIMRTRITESVSPVPFVGLTDSVHKIDGIPVNEESFSTDVTLAAVAQSPVVSISTKKHKSSHQRTSTPQLSSERRRTTTGNSLESTINIDGKEEDTEEVFGIGMRGF